MGQRLLQTLTYCSLGLLVVTGAFGQDQPPFAPNQQQDQTPHPWRSADATPSATQPDMTPDQAPPPPPNFSAPPSNLPNPNTPLPQAPNGAYGNAGYGNGGYANGGYAPAP